MERMKTDYFILKTVEVTKAGQIVQFETKMPGDAKTLAGYQLSATKSHDTKALAIVGISFNGARQNTINQELFNRNPANIRRRATALSQNMPLLPNAYTKGFVEDLGVAAIPYTVKIYFKLSTN